MVFASLDCVYCFKVLPSHCVLFSTVVFGPVGRSAFRSCWIASLGRHGSCPYACSWISLLQLVLSSVNIPVQKGRPGPPVGRSLLPSFLMFRLSAGLSLLDSLGPSSTRFGAVVRALLSV